MRFKDINITSFVPLSCPYGVNNRTDFCKTERAVITVKTVIHLDDPASVADQLVKSFDENIKSGTLALRQEECGDCSDMTSVVEIFGATPPTETIAPDCTILKQRRRPIVRIVGIAVGSLLGFVAF